MADPAPTLKVTRFKRLHCTHCNATTVQYDGDKGRQCMQCIADGGTCCSLRAYSRWPTRSDTFTDTFSDTT